jgi:hypothetical protein
MQPALRFGAATIKGGALTRCPLDLSQGAISKRHLAGFRFSRIATLRSSSRGLLLAGLLFRFVASVMSDGR